MSPPKEPYHHQYLLDDDGNPYPAEDTVEDMFKAAEQLGDIKKRRVDLTELSDKIYVSTVFLGINHQYGDGPPMIYETMAFGLDDEHMRRASTKEEAQKYHDEVVELVKKELAEDDG